MKVIAIVGSYRAGGVTEHLVDAVLEGARRCGAECEVVTLRDLDMRHCANCRECLQVPGEARGRCVIADDLPPLLARIDAADALVLAAPVNMGNVTALTRVFMERCAGAAYWPWGAKAPRLRGPAVRPAVLVSSSAAPAWMARLLMSADRALKDLARLLGARPLGFVWQGMVDRDPMPIAPAVRRRAEALGARLVASP